MIDTLGQSFLKTNLHMHTDLSDGAISPEEAARLYKERGYDLVAITDHWKYQPGGIINGLRVLSGAEYNFGGSDGGGELYHIVALGCKHDPAPRRDESVQTCIDKIRAAGGLAVLAHPAWSLNTVEQASKLKGIGATEIFNAVSTAGESDRPYSGDFVDKAACRGMIFPLLADDDTHYYDGSDETKGWIMLNASIDASDEEILKAIVTGKFYATSGPSVMVDFDGEELRLKTSPSEKIMFFSNLVWANGHGHRGKGISSVSYTLKENESFIRAEITDHNGNKAWTNIYRR